MIPHGVLFPSTCARPRKAAVLPQPQLYHYVTHSGECPQRTWQKVLIIFAFRLIVLHGMCWIYADLKWFNTQLLLGVAFTRLQNDGAVFVRTSISLQAMISTLVSKRSKSKTHPTHRTAQGSDRMIWISRYSDIGWHWHILTPIVCFKRSKNHSNTSQKVLCPSIFHNSQELWNDDTW